MIRIAQSRYVWHVDILAGVAEPSACMVSSCHCSLIIFTVENCGEQQPMDGHMAPQADSGRSGGWQSTGDSGGSGANGSGGVDGDGAEVEGQEGPASQRLRSLEEQVSPHPFTPSIASCLA